MQRRINVLMTTVVLSALALVLSAAASAQGLPNELSYLTFSAPVEIPGQVLPAGSYEFRLLDPGTTDRSVMQILSKDGSKVYATLLTIPDERLKPVNKPTVTFEERAARAPEAIRAFFYPGDSIGEEFVYPRVRAIELAKANHVPVASIPSELASNLKQPARTANEPSVMALKKAPIKAINPQGEEVDVATVIPGHRGTRQGSSSE